MLRGVHLLLAHEMPGVGQEARHATALFHMMDQDHSGTIEKGELVAAHGELRLVVLVLVEVEARFRYDRRVAEPERNKEGEFGIDLCKGSMHTQLVCDRCFMF